MSANLEDGLSMALALTQLERQPRRLRATLKEAHQRADMLQRAGALLSEPAQGGLDEMIATLTARNISATFIGEPTYPRSLASLKAAPPVLFMWGSADLLHDKSVGMCGSRNVSSIGMDAARVSGGEVAAHSLTVVSGYAKGVDTETHLAALRSEGRTVIVLAEGILQFRRKRVFDSVPFDERHVLAISQFPPTQRWTVGAAMTRNGVIAGLGRALVVIEAGETGGTLDAGLQALAMGRPVIALEFESQETPAGNRQLIARGAVPVRTKQQLGRVLEALAGDGISEETLQQLALL